MQVIDGQPIQASPKQPEIVTLAKGSHSIPLGGTKLYTVDKITFTCPMHPPALDENELPIEDEKTGMFTQGHEIAIMAHVGRPYPYKTKDGHVFQVYGYTLSGTTITIMPQIICECTKVCKGELSQELRQETGERYIRQIPLGFKENYASEEPLIALCQEVVAGQR